MKKIKKLLDDNFQGVLLVVGIAMANLVFFQQQSWKMDPVKIALLSLGFFFLLRIFTGQIRNIRDIRDKTGIILLGLSAGSRYGSYISRGSCLMMPRFPLPWF